MTTHQNKKPASSLTNFLLFLFKCYDRLYRDIMLLIGRIVYKPLLKKMGVQCSTLQISGKPLIRLGKKQHSSR